MSVYGEIAAVLTALCWSFNSVVFTRAGLRVGAAPVNAFRLWIALPALASPFDFKLLRKLSD